uniref:Uncharacterized protein n=1 Tax=Oryza barthii TaxID=65489 RepID=A0A0D3GDH3_9ORYZ
MASSLLVAFLLLSSYAVLSICSSRPIAGGVEVIWSTGAATTTMEAEGGQSHRRRGGGTSVVVRYLVARRTVMGMEVPSRESTMIRRLLDREPVVYLQRHLHAKHWLLPKSYNTIQLRDVIPT